MAVKQYTVRVQAPVVAGGTVIDQMVDKMTRFQRDNGGRGVYSFELPEPEWQFLGENYPGTERMNFKPSDRYTVQLNDFVESWGRPVLKPDGRGGHRAFEGGPDAGNLTLIQAAGAQNNAVWDAATDSMYFHGASTGSQAAKQALLKYNAATDEFVHWTSGSDTATPDGEASLWPAGPEYLTPNQLPGVGYGIPHNFGMTAWDPQRQRYYKMVRLESPLRTEWWITRTDIGLQSTYATRDAWLAGRGTWFKRFPATTATPPVSVTAWPQIIFVPTVGAEGSVYIIQVNANRVFRFDCATHLWNDVTSNFRFNITRVSQSETGDTYLSPGAAFCCVDGFVYAVGHVNASGVPELWRFAPTENAFVGPVVRATPPQDMSLAGYGWPGNHTELCHYNGKIYAFHADTFSRNGNIKIYDGGVYTYDINANTWSDRIGTSWIEKLVNDHGVPFDMTVIGTASSQDFIVTEIPRLGVFQMVQSYSSRVCASWLFKPPL